LLTVVHVCESLMLITARTIFCGRLYCAECSAITHAADSAW